jgi:hypothetical protein
VACFVLCPDAVHQAAADEHPANSIDDLAKSLIKSNLVKGLSIGIATLDE